MADPGRRGRMVGDARICKFRASPCWEREVGAMGSDRQGSLKHRRPRPARALRPWVELMDERLLLSTFIVINTNDAGPGSLRQAILNSNATIPALTGGTNDIIFEIP